MARPAAPDERRPLHLTLALDCSGSMAQPGGLDRVRLGLEELLTHLRPVDTVAVVAFSDQARVVLPATPGGDPAPIARALAGLTPGGATNAVEGLALAYQLAAEHLEPGSENRVLFATDGGTLAGADAQVVIERVAALQEPRHLAAGGRLRRRRLPGPHPAAARRPRGRPARLPRQR